MPTYPSDRYAVRHLYLVHFTGFHPAPVVVAAASPAEAQLLVEERVGTVALVEDYTAVSHEDAYGKNSVLSILPANR